MFKQIDNEVLYFSTTSEVKISGITYRPSICYKVPPLSKGSLEKMKSVTLYTEPVRFVNGSVAKAAMAQKATPVTSVVKSQTPNSITRKKR